MAESVDALVSNTSGREAVPVRPRLRVLNRSLPFFRETFLFHPFCLSLFLSHPEQKEFGKHLIERYLSRYSCYVAAKTMTLCRKFDKTCIGRVAEDLIAHPELQLIRKSGVVRDAFSTNPKFAERDCYLNSADNQIVINVLRALRAVFPAQGAVPQHNRLIISENYFCGALCEFRVQQIRDGSIYARFK